MSVRTHSKHIVTKTALAVTLVLGLTAGLVFLLFTEAMTPALATEAVESVEDDTGSETMEERRESLALKVNQIVYLPLEGSWSITIDNTAVVKLSSTGSVTAKKVGKATLTCVGDDETIIFDVTVSKSNFKPVAMKKLPCYKNYRKYMTEAQFKKAYNKALKMVLPAGDLSKKEQLRYVTGALRAYFDQNMSYTSSKPHYNDPYGYLCLNRASCAGCARTTGLCLNILGIKFEHVNENKWTHQWCRVKVGNQYWIADPYGMYCGKEPAKKKHPYF